MLALASSLPSTRNLLGLGLLLLALTARATPGPTGIGEESSPGSLDLTRAMEIALENNFDRRISREEVRAAEARVTETRGALLPQVEADVTYLRNREEAPAVQAGSAPKESADLALRASQILFNDRQLASFRSSREEQAAARASDDAVRLDVLASAGLAYVEYLSVRSSLRIAEDNLRITRENLEIARIRNEVGTVGPEEVLRFESEEAQQESELFRVRSLLHSAANRLNRALGLAPDTEWELTDLDLGSEVFRTSLGTLLPPKGEDTAGEPSWRSLRRASIDTSLARSPELASLRSSAEGQRILLNERRRSFFVPDLTASADYGYNLDADYTTTGRERDKESWTVRLTASLPLFEGLSRVGEVRGALAGLRRISWEEARLRQEKAIEVSDSLAALQSSRRSIELSRIAAERAEANLTIVQDKYEQGTVSIVDLLDAQNNALVQRQTASIELYRFLQDLLRFQRAIGWFEPVADEESRARIASRFRAPTEDS